MNLAAFLVSLRESLEAAVILVIFSAYLKRTGRSGGSYVWIGALLSVLLSVVTGIIVVLVYGGIGEKALFEAVASYTAVIILTGMIHWMARRGRYLRDEIERRIEMLVSPLALTSFSFILVFREGLETVLFLVPFAVRDPPGTILGLGAGIIAASSIAFLIYSGGMRLDLRRFFYYSSILLILVAAGLVGYGTHELLEWIEDAGYSAGLLGEEAYNLAIPESSPYHHNGVLGSILAVLIGYSTSMEWGRLLLQVGYLVAAMVTLLRAYHRGE